MKKTISQKLNNNGFSLIELIVIMVIMVILSVAAVGSFVNSAGQKVTASTTIISKYLSDVMNYTMTGKYNNVNFESETGNETQTVKKAAELKIENRDGKFYISDGIGKEEQLKSGIDITYKTETGNTYDAAKNALVLTFSRLNGSFNPITTS
nr:prepilin-type N-terminal cleavage/methylation domain-containing protein [Lachnospiraceae bacterium]